MNSTTQLHKKQSATLANTLQTPCIINLEGEKARVQRTDFDSLLLSAVNSAFSTLGESAALAIFSYLKNHGVVRECIPQNLEGFASALEEIFGQGALILETNIIQSLHLEVKEFKYVSARKGLSFPKYLGALREFLGSK